MCLKKTKKSDDPNTYITIDKIVLRTDTVDGNKRYYPSDVVEKAIKHCRKDTSVKYFNGNINDLYKNSPYNIYGYAEKLYMDKNDVHAVMKFRDKVANINTLKMLDNAEFYLNIIGKCDENNRVSEISFIDSIIFTIKTEGKQ